MPLFEVAILERPTKKEIEEEGKQEVLIFGPKAIIANDTQSAGIAAVIDQKDLQVNNARMKVLVRPFE